MTKVGNSIPRGELDQLDLKPVPRSISCGPTLWTLSEQLAQRIGVSTSGVWRLVLIDYIENFVALLVPNPDAGRGATSLIDIFGEEWPKDIRPAHTLRVDSPLPVRLLREMQRDLRRKRGAT